MRRGLSIAKKLIIALVIVAILAVVAFFVIRYFISKNKTYNSYKVIAEQENTGNTNAHFLTSDEVVVRYTFDGVSGFDGDAKEIWNVSYEMSNPIADVCGVYSAVADQNSQNLYILDGSGDVNKIETEYAIQQISVAEEGITAVWMADGTKDYVTVYKKDGSKIIDMMTAADSDGIPVAMELSEDGSRLVTSYAAYAENELTNQVTFYNFGELGSNYVDRLVGTKSYSDRLVGDFEFKGDIVVAFSDVGFELYDMELTEEDIKDVKISDTIRQVEVSDEYIGVVTLNDAGELVATVYNLKGDEKDKKTLKDSYQHFDIIGDELVFFGGTELYITRIGGKDKATLTLEMDIEAVYASKKINQYLIAGENRFQIIELTETEAE